MTKFFAGIFTPVLFFINGLTHEWVVSLVLMTLFVRIVLLPLTFKQQKFLKTQQILSQKINQLKARYKNDPNKLNEKITELMIKAKSNPILGFLSLFAQMPVLVGLYATFSQLSAASSLLPWVQNLSSPDPTHILPVGAAIINVLGAKLGAAAGNTGTANAAGTAMLNMVLVGAVSLLFLWKAPVGIAVYWGTSGLLTSFERFGIEKFWQRRPIMTELVESTKNIKIKE